MDYSILIEDVEFTPGVFIDINVNVYVNENAQNWTNNGKIFAVEGMSHTANCLKPLAEELFMNPPEMEVNEFYAIDMPGRGGSGFPEGWNPLSNDVFKLSDMYLEHYVAVIRGALTYLNEVQDVKPSTIMGHSLGGLEVILFQDMLLQEGTNMRKEFGIKNAVLLAPGIPAPLTWSYLGTGAGTLIPLAYEHPAHGWILGIPTAMWPWVFFTNTCCYFPPSPPFPPYTLPPGAQVGMVEGAPDEATVIANGYRSIEAAPLLFHMAGLPFTLLDPDTYHPVRPRVSANPGIFKPQHGVQLTIIADEFDKMMSPDEEMPLYEYLTGDKNFKRFHVVLGEETCHDTHISDPAALVELLSPATFKDAEANATEEFRNAFSIYPNPASSFLTIEFKLERAESPGISLLNALGTTVKEIQPARYPAGIHQASLDLSGLPAGIYFVKYTCGKEVQIKKITKIN